MVAEGAIDAAMPSEGSWDCPPHQATCETVQATMRSRQTISSDIASRGFSDVSTICILRPERSHMPTWLSSTPPLQRVSAVPPTRSHPVEKDIPRELREQRLPDEPELDRWQRLYLRLMLNEG